MINDVSFLTLYMYVYGLYLLLYHNKAKANKVTEIEREYNRNLRND